MSMFARALHERGHLGPGISAATARDVLWTYNSAEVFELLVLQRGWSSRRYGRWVADVDRRTSRSRMTIRRLVAWARGTPTATTNRLRSHLEDGRELGRHLLPPRSGQDLLDVGAARARSLVTLARRAPRAGCRIDSSAEVIAQARRRAVPSSPLVTRIAWIWTMSPSTSCTSTRSCITWPIRRHGAAALSAWRLAVREPTTARREPASAGLDRWRAYHLVRPQRRGRCQATCRRGSARLASTSSPCELELAFAGPTGRGGGVMGRWRLSAYAHAGRSTARRRSSRPREGGARVGHAPDAPVRRPPRRGARPSLNHPSV